MYQSSRLRLLLPLKPPLRTFSTIAVQGCWEGVHNIRVKTEKLLLLVLWIGLLKIFLCKTIKEPMTVNNFIFSISYPQLYANDSRFKPRACSNVYRYLEVKWECIESAQQPEHFACDGEKLKLSCPAGQIIEITGANYGRRVRILKYKKTWNLQ